MRLGVAGAVRGKMVRTSLHGTFTMADAATTAMAAAIDEQVDAFFAEAH
ncbi:hypothetical protein FHW12_002502 [Dokdonella fugitiva]|uniref:Uncharacterized protein n=1 Tax=Dokdonella fugitiva TaxID=328517 RepID=A0A839F411_9GAMM|nr:hypothetical protein [Dokdonella fugitiva]MBA8888278.1 hypothetical protein [Dokdonella fugitiva]